MYICVYVCMYVCICICVCISGHFLRIRQWGGASTKRDHTEMK